MKPLVGLYFAAAFGFLGASLALAGPGRMDTSKRAIRMTTTDNKAALPDNMPLQRNEVLLDKRAVQGDQKFFRNGEKALVGERRSGIEVGETREKQLFVTPDHKAYDTLDAAPGVAGKESPWQGKESRYSTSEDAYRSKVAIRFQDKISDASPVTKNVKPVVSQRTTFDRVNRFVFRKNGDQAVSVSVAGSEKSAGDASASASPDGKSAVAPTAPDNPGPSLGR
jgi:hypothetical protein